MRHLGIEVDDALENRARLMLEVIAAVSDVWDSDRVGLRISPLNSYNDMNDSDPVGLATRLNDCKLPICT